MKHVELGNQINTNKITIFFFTIGQAIQDNS